MSKKKLTQAFILAAGYGTRLKPLTDNLPKALVGINGVPMLEILINKLIKSGIKRIVINTHHFAEKIENFIKNKNFDAQIILSYEPEILDTGGGILNAKNLFDLNNDILIHNVDIISDVDFSEFYDFHISNSAIASLFVQDRETSRYLMFDADNNLSGWINKKTGEKIISRQVGDYMQLAFNGVHIISPEIFDLFTQKGKFSIIPQYLEISKKHKITAFENKKYYWQDSGKIDILKQIESDIESLKL